MRPDLTERIPRHRRIIDFRNVLIHGYASVMPKRVWDYAENRLPNDAGSCRPCLLI